MSETETQEKPNIQDQAKQAATEGMSRLKKAAIALLTFLAAILITLGVAFLIARHQYKQFTKNAQLNNQQVLDLVRYAFKNSFKDVAKDNQLTLLLLGTDEVSNRDHLPPLTDTMILLSYKKGADTVNAISLPRDLWSEAYKTKINALYTYGIDKNPDQPFTFPEQVIEEMTGVKIDYSFVITLEQLAELIDLMGGVEIEIEQGFTDKKFPRSDVDITVEHDPAKLYETVTFEKGTEVMSGERALKYIRSRHSGDDQGTDIARSQRQQQVLNALINQASEQQNIFLNPGTLGKLYHFYDKNMSQYLPSQDVAALFYAIKGQLRSLSFATHSLPIVPENENGIIYHPDPAPAYQNQWVYLVKDINKFKEFITNSLQLK